MFCFFSCVSLLFAKTQSRPNLHCLLSIRTRDSIEQSIWQSTQLASTMARPALSPTSSTSPRQRAHVIDAESNTSSSRRSSLAASTRIIIIIRRPASSLISKQRRHTVSSYPRRMQQSTTVRLVGAETGVTEEGEADDAFPRVIGRRRDWSSRRLYVEQLYRFEEQASG
jgi:hypothetical protein